MKTVFATMILACAMVLSVGCAHHKCGGCGDKHEHKCTDESCKHEKKEGCKDGACAMKKSSDAAPAADSTKTPAQ